MKVNTSNWHAFKISDIFETQSKGKKLQVPTGANVPVKDLVKMAQHLELQLQV